MAQKTISALEQLVASVSHNAKAAVLPGEPPSNQQQFNGELPTHGLPFIPRVAAVHCRGGALSEQQALMALAPPAGQ